VAHLFDFFENAASIDTWPDLHYHRKIMNIEVSLTSQRYIEAQLQQGLFNSPAEVIDALVQQRQNGSACSATIEFASQQREKLLRLIEECAALSPATPRDNFSNREHDLAIYGDRK
jgi:hypothetical protein